jgi:hypothetical protein
VTVTHHTSVIERCHDCHDGCVLPLVAGLCETNDRAHNTTSRALAPACIVLATVTAPESDAAIQAGRIMSVDESGGAAISDEVMQSNVGRASDTLSSG